MLKMPDENKFPGVSNYIHDYGMNLVVLKNLSKEEEERFQSDFKYLVKYLRNCKEPEKVVKLFREEFGDMLHQKETMRAMAALTKDGRYLTVEAGKKEASKVSCAVLDYVEAKAEKRGEVKSKIETCQEFGVTREETLSRLMQKYELDENTARDYMDQYWLK